MQNLQYEQLEQTFLEAKARDWFRKEQHKLVFIQRLLVSNNDLSHKGLAEVLETPLLAASTSRDPDRQDPPDPVKVMRGILSKTIFPKLESEGCPSKEATKDKREIAQAWLRETIYPDWLFDYCWQQLSSQGKNHIRKMGPKFFEHKKSGTLGMVTKNVYLEKVPNNSDIVFEVNCGTSGHLLLLERAPDENIYCICPSEYAPEMSLSEKPMVLPQSDSTQPFFRVDGVGVEQLLAVISPNELPFDWLAQSKIEALVLNNQHLLQLWNYLQERKDCQLLYTQYVVTA